MWIDESGEDILTGGVDYLSVLRRAEIAIDPCNRLVLAENICDVAFVRRDDLAVLD
jgi:hypothetical protein